MIHSQTEHWQSRFWLHRARGTFSPGWVLRRWKTAVAVLGIGTYVGNIALTAAARAVFDGLRTGTTSLQDMSRQASNVYQLLMSGGARLALSSVLILGVLLWLFWAYHDATRRLAFLAVSKPRRSVPKDRVALGSEISIADVSPRAGPWSQHEFIERKARYRGASVNALEAMLAALASPLGGPLLVLGPAGMGKTRIAVEAIRLHRPWSIVFVPATRAVPPSALQYCKGREVIVLWDDANEHVSVNTDIVDAVNELTDIASEVLTVFTCSTTALSTILGDGQPRLKALLSGAQTFEILPLDPLEMRRLGAEGPAALYGNPGMFLRDLDSLRTEFSVAERPVRQLLESSWALFQCGIFPITPQRVAAVTQHLFGLLEDVKAPDDGLAWLASRTFLRSASPVLVEEFVCQGVLGELTGWNRRDGILQALRGVGDVSGLYQVGVQLAERGADIREIEMAYRECARIGVRDHSPNALTMAARALVNLATKLDDAGRPDADVEGVSQEAIDLGLKTRTPAGLEAASRALSNLGIIQIARKRDVAAVVPQLARAAAMGKQAGTQIGLTTAAKSLYNLGVVVAGTGAPVKETRQFYEDAADLGRQSGTTEGLLLAGGALSNLAASMLSAGSTRSEVELVYERAIDCGRDANTPEGLVLAGRTSVLRGLDLTRGGAPLEKVTSTYREAISYGLATQSEDGRAVVIHALAQLGEVLGSVPDPQEALSLIADLRTHGNATQSAESMALASQSLFNIANSLREPLPDESARAYEDAEALGRKSGTSTGLLAAANASLNRGRLRSLHRGDAGEILRAFERASEAAQQAQSPAGFETAAIAQIEIADRLEAEDGDAHTIGSAYSLAADLAQEASTTRGFVLRSRACAGLGIVRQAQGQGLNECQQAFEEASRSGQASGESEGLCHAAASQVNLGNLLRMHDIASGARRCYEEGTRLGRSTGESAGQAIAAGSQLCLAELLVESGASDEDIDRAYQVAAELGRKACTPNGLFAASEALSLRARRMAARDVDLDETKSVFEESISLGLTAGTAEGTLASASSAFHLANLMRLRECDLAEVAKAFDRSVQLARQVNTSEALGIAASASLNQGICLARLNHPSKSALDQALILGARAGSRIGLRAAAAAQFEIARGGIHRYDAENPDVLASEMLVLLVSRLKAEIRASQTSVNGTVDPSTTSSESPARTMAELEAGCRLVHEWSEHLIRDLVPVIEDARLRRDADAR